MDWIMMDWEGISGKFTGWLSKPDGSEYRRKLKQ